MVPADSRRIPRAPRYSGYHYASSDFMYGTVTFCGATFQKLPFVRFLATTWSYNPCHAVTWQVWAIPRSLATTWGIIIYFLFLQVLRCFSSLRADQRSFAPTRGLSQLITSFIASESQGIRHAPLLTFLSYRHSSRYILSAFNFYFHFVHHVIDRRE